MAAPEAQYPMGNPQMNVAYQAPMMPITMQHPPMHMQPVQKQQMAPVYGQQAQAPYGMYAPPQATKKEDSDSSSSDSSDSDSD